MAMNRRGLLGLLLGIPVFLAACGSGDVTGTIYLATAGGQAKRGADVAVTLVAWTDRLQHELGQLEAAFRTEMQPLIEAYDEAKARRDRLALDSSRYSAARDQVWAEIEAMGEVRRAYRQRVATMLTRHKARLERTGADGAYRFVDAPTGRALLIAEWATDEFIGSSLYPINHVWMLPLEIKRGENRIDLSGSNKTGAFWTG